MHLKKTTAILTGLVIISLFGGMASAQSSMIRGFVTDDTNGESLPGANVALENASGSLFGSVSDNDGFYSVGGLQPGRYVFRVSFVGFTTFVDTLQIGTGQLTSIDVALVLSSEELDELVVDATRTTGAARTLAGLQTILPADIDRVPSPDIAGDLAMLLTTLPGVVTVGDQGGQVFIRGGEPWQNLVLLDGMIVFQPFHILGFFSAFPSEILNSVDIYAGGYGARYGGRISSVIDITTRRGNNKRYAGAVTLSPFVMGVRAEGPLTTQKNISFLASFRQSVLERGASRLIDRPVPYNFNDLFVKIHGQFGRSSRLSFTTLQTYDRGKIGEDVGLTPLSEVRWRNKAVGFRYLYLPGSMPVLAEVSITVSDLTSELGPEEAPIRSASISRLNSYANVTLYGDAVDVTWGLFARTLEISSELGGLFQNIETDKEWVTEVGIYIEPEFRLGQHVRVTPSLRVHSFPSKSTRYIEPRLRATWEFGRHRLSAAGGVYHQETVGVSDRRDATSVFTAWTTVPRGAGVPRAIHQILGYNLQTDVGVNISLEAFRKDLSNLFIAEWTAYPRLTTRLQKADGRVNGLDARVELRRPNFYGYINYGLSSVEYWAQQATIELWYGTERYRFRPAHDRRHQINVLASTRLFAVDLSARWQFGSGLPYNRALGFDGFILMDGIVDVFSEEGSQRVIYEAPYNGVLPTYHRLDISMEYGFDLAAAEITLQGSLLNVYDRSNIFYLDIFTLERADQLPLIPSFGMKIAFD